MKSGVWANIYPKTVLQNYMKSYFSVDGFHQALKIH